MNLYMKQFAPRKTSKTQIRKRAEALLHPPVLVGCGKCGIQIATLRKAGVDKNGEKVYLCPDCYAKATSTVTKPWVS